MTTRGAGGGECVRRPGSNVASQLTNVNVTVIVLATTVWRRERPSTDVVSDLLSGLGH